MAISITPAGRRWTIQVRVFDHKNVFGEIITHDGKKATITTSLSMTVSDRLVLISGAAEKPDFVFHAFMDESKIAPTFHCAGMGNDGVETYDIQYDFTKKEKS